MSRLKRLISEIHHRSLWQVLLIYVGGAWFCYELIDTVTDRLALPPWLPGLAIVLFLLALPVVVATAFVHDEGVASVAPAEGTEVEATAHHKARRRHRFLTWRNAGLSFLVALALWGVVAAGLLLVGGYGAAPADERRSLAVLPFANLSPDPDDAYFADGIHDEIISQLGKIASLKVISRTSVMEYRDQTKNLRLIADQLGVTNILEGTVRRVGDRVRITTQLIDAQNDEHLWAETYDRDYADVLSVQAELAQTIASVLEAALTPQEVERIQAKPTDNPQAYEQYLRGSEYLNRSYQENDLRIAAQMFSKAVQLDPDFAGAYARLSVANVTTYWHGYDPKEDRLAQAREAAEKAFQLDPDLPDAHLAMGYYHYYGQRDYEMALAEFSSALRLQPNNSDVLAATAYVQRRRGEWDLALNNLKKAFELDPRSPIKAQQVGSISRWMRDYGEAMHYYDLAISLSPETTELYNVKAGLILDSTGDPEEALRVIEEGPEMNVADLPAGNAAELWRLYFIAGKYERPLQELNRRTVGDDTTRYFLAKAELHELLGQRDIARAHYDSARVALESLILQGRNPGEPFNVRCRLGIAYAALGRKDDALHEGRACVERLPLSRDALYGNYNLGYRVQIYAMVGEADSAVAQLD